MDQALGETAPVRQHGRAEVRLVLSEWLLAAGEAADCADRTLQWLRDHCGVSRALCALADAELTRINGIAGLGIHPVRVASFSLPLDRGEHPLVAALARGRPSVVSLGRGEAARPLAPIGNGSALAVPLLGGGARTPARVGLLLVLPAALRAMDDLRWAARLLAQRLGQLRTVHELSDAHRRLTSERFLLESITNAVTDPMLVTDTEGRLIIANARAEALFASTESASEGWRRAIALNNMLLSAALTQRAFSTTEPARRELLLVDPIDGTDLLFELLSTVILDARSGTRLVSILRNVTDLRRATQEIEANYQKLRVAEATVRDERDRLNLIIDSVAEPILVTDPSGNFVLMNAPAERLFASEERGARGEEIQRAVRANDARFSSFVSNLFFEETAQHRRREFSLLDPRTGAEIPFEAFSGKILSQHGEVTGVVTILHDRTEMIEKARLYEQLKHASDELEGKVREATSELVRQNELLRLQHIQLEQASALKSQFLANMSHEFRTPLNAILGYTSMLLEEVCGALLSPQRKQLQRIDSNAKHLLTIMNDLLDISRIEAGKMPVHVSEFEIPDLVTEVTESEPSARLKVIQDVQPALPPLRSDRQKVKQILLNLFANALKFTPEGSVTIRAWHDRGSDQIAIAVEDTGIGIPESEQENVFEAFSQADNSPSRQYGGAGLGLTICRRLSAMLGGRLTLVSSFGRGSTFTLHLPRRMRHR